ncbi:hypothetical protein L1987_20590 [Smallanthus sonchifolius]|uniref:Uncharacterized protein n=1 Tax=Smallanthus sonchifolius TaxID=185202 RepID=A0ACB9ITV7_9ASTR|nr:hypothetical protein L1987_20590 [Smallanthus sonchifolius]
MWETINPNQIPFFRQMFTFRNGGSGLVDSTCDACGKKIKRLHYRCTCTYLKRNLHPGYETTLEAAYGLTMNLQKTATSKCLHCETKDLSYKSGFGDRRQPPPASVSVGGEQTSKRRTERMSG